MALLVGRSAVRRPFTNPNVATRPRIGRLDVSILLLPVDRSGLLAGTSRKVGGNAELGFRREARADKVVGGRSWLTRTDSRPRQSDSESATYRSGAR